MLPPIPKAAADIVWAQYPRPTKASILACCVVKDKRLVAVLLRPKGAGHVLGAVHDAAALVVEAEDGGHTVAAGAALSAVGAIGL